MIIKNIAKFLSQNIGIKQTILKNTFWLTSSQVIAGTLSAILAILIARHLGVEGFGKFSFAFSFVVIFSVFTDFGLITLTTRELARNGLMVKKYIDNIIIIKFILGLLTLGIIILALNFLNKTAEVKLLIFWAGIWMIIQSFPHFFQSIFRAFEQMEYEAISKIAYSLTSFIIVFYIINTSLGLKFLIQGYVFSALVGLIITIFLIRKRFVKFKSEVDLLFWKNLFREAWPFAIFTIFAGVYFQISTVILSILDTDSAVGLYSIAFNSVIIFFVLPDIVSGSVLPTLSKLFVKKNLLKELSKKLIILMLCIGLILAIVLFFGAPFFIKLIYGKEFAGATLAFQIMVWVLPLRFMNYLFAVFLIAANLQKKRLNAAIICALFNILMNLILIPAFSFEGAAVATLLTEIILFLLYFIFYKNVIKSDNKSQILTV